MATPHVAPTVPIAFVARLTPVCVARDERRSIGISAAFRQALQRDRDACGPASRLEPST